MNFFVHWLSITQSSLVKENSLKVAYIEPINPLEVYLFCPFVSCYPSTTPPYPQQIKNYTTHTYRERERERERDRETERDREREREK